MRFDFGELAAHRFKDGGSDIHEIPSIADQRAFVSAEVAEVEEVALSSSGLVHERTGEIFALDVIAKDDDKDWDLEGIMTAGKVEASELRSKMRALHEKCRSTSVEV